MKAISFIHDNTLSFADNLRRLSVQVVRQARTDNAKAANRVINPAPAYFNAAVEQIYPDLYAQACILAQTARLSSAGRRGNTYFTSLSFRGDSSFEPGDPFSVRPDQDDILQLAIIHIAHCYAGEKA